MDWFTGTIVYVLIWWTVLFAVLPFGTRPMSDADPETGWRGVPERPLMLRKIVATTVVAVVVWIGAYALIRSDWISFRHGFFAMPDH